MDDETLGKLIELRRAGMSFARIAQQLGITPDEAEQALNDALPGQSVEELRRLELDRLDRLQTAIWPRALRGDVGAVDRAIALSRLRLQLAGAPLGETPMTEAYERVVDDLGPDDADAALIEAGRWIVRQIDAAANSGDPATEAKAVFMVPHFVNVLRELNATPATREELKRAAAAMALPPVSKENDLERFKRAHRRPPKGA